MNPESSATAQMGFLLITLQGTLYITFLVRDVDCFKLHKSASVIENL